MEAAIVKIGNSKGLRLSKSIIEQYNIQEKVELILEKGRIILQPVEKPRKEWETAFMEMRKANDDELLMNDVFENENPEEWR